MVLRLSDSWSNWNIEMLVFEARGKPEYPEKNRSIKFKYSEDYHFSAPTTSKQHSF